MLWCSFPTAVMMARLELVSLSSRTLERDVDSYDLVLDLSSKPLPAFSMVNCWKARSISPLRDRTMIEWLFSHRPARSLLKEMTSQINKTLTSRATTSSSSESGQSAPSSTLCVAVACQNGAQLSVCFVEKLYEQYSFESPLELDGVKVEVKRKHSEAIKGEWLNTKDAVWQHSHMSCKTLFSHKDLILNRTWCNFPTKSSSEIEAAFRQDPFAKKVDIGKHVVYFDTGIAFNKRSRNEFRVRSAIPSLEGKVHSSWVQDVGKKQFFCGAGILFYAVHPRTGEAVFLLGHMTYSSMAWCDFGGMRNHGEQPRYTAARECYEETLGVLGETDDLASKLENCVDNNIFEIVNKDTRYVGYYLRVPYKDYPSAFKKAIMKTLGRKEVDEIRWFSLSSLRSGIQKALLDQYDLSVGSLKEDGTIADSQCLQLRQEFVHSLCIAEQLGVLKSIEHIAKTLHRRSQPLSSMVTVKASLEAITTEDNNLLEDGQKLQDYVHSAERERIGDVVDKTAPNVSKDDTCQKDCDYEEKWCTSRPNEELDSSKSETTDSKMKAAATNSAIDSVSKFRYHGTGAGTFLN